MEHLNNKNKIIYHKKRKNRATKLHLVFDEEARKEFLTGFRKRKIQRQKKAQQELEEKLREERKRLRQEANESYKRLVVSYRPIPELEQYESQDYDMGNHVVSIVELSTDEIAKKNNWIGANQVKYEDPKSNVNIENTDINKNGKVKESIPGMNLKTEKGVKNSATGICLKTEKDVKKILKKEATKQMKKSVPFQMKNKIEQRKNKKKSMKERNKRLKLQSRDKKFKSSAQNSVKSKHKKRKS